MDSGTPEARAFVCLEDWANDGPPLPEAAAREMFEAFLGADLPGAGEWRVGGVAVEPERFPSTLLNIVATTDRIVPHSSEFTGGVRLDLASRHVALAVGGRARRHFLDTLERLLSRSPRRSVLPRTLSVEPPLPPRLAKPYS